MYGPSTHKKLIPFLLKIVQTELSNPARQVETLPLSQSHGRTSPTTPPTLVPRTKLS